MRAHKLKFVINKIPSRGFKDAHKRIIGQGDIVKGALKDLEAKLKQIPRNALGQWKNYVKQVKDGEILDSLNGHRLNAAMNRIPKRTLKDSMQRIMGQGNKIVAVLKGLEMKV